MIAARSFLPLTLLCVLNACTVPRTQPETVTSGTQFAATGNADVIYFDMQGILWRMPASGGSAISLSDARDDLRRPQLSPDGTQLVMQSFAAGHWDIVVSDTNGNNRRVLAASEFDDREPAWSIDGNAVLFSSDRSGNDDIWSVDVASGTVTQLTNDLANDYAPAAIKNGFVFVSDRNRTPALFLQQDEQLQELAKAPAGRGCGALKRSGVPDGSVRAWPLSVIRRAPAARSHSQIGVKVASASNRPSARQARR